MVKHLFGCSIKKPEPRNSNAICQRKKDGLRNRGAATSLRKAKIEIKLLARVLIEVRVYYLGN